MQGYCVSELRTSSILEGKQRNRKVSKAVFFSSYIHDKNVQSNQNVPIKEMLHFYRNTKSSLHTYRAFRKNCYKIFQFAFMTVINIVQGCLNHIRWKMRRIRSRIQFPKLIKETIFFPSQNQTPCK